MPEIINKLVERQIHRWSRLEAVLKKGRTPSEAKSPLRRPVITISRQVGSGGRIIAKALSERLGLDLFGVSIIDAIAESANLERRVIDSLDESVRTDFENRIAGILRGRVIDNQEYATRLARVLTAIATHGRAIILGRGGAQVLRECAHLRLRFYAPVEFRVKNEMAYENKSEGEARAYVKEIDERRRLFVKRLFRADIDDPAYYDISIDTSRVPPADCVEIVVMALKLRTSPEEIDNLNLDDPD